MDTALFIIVALTASTPIAGAIIVSIASRREDRDWTLGETAVGPVQMVARRILGFHTEANRRQSLERARVLRGDSVLTPSQQPPRAGNRRGRHTEPSSRLLVASR